MNAVRSNNLSLKYQRFTSSGFKDKEIKKIDCGKDSSPLITKINLEGLI